MIGERVDLDDLRTLANAALESARSRSDRTGPEGQAERGAERWILVPRRDGLVFVVVASSGADVFDRALQVDAAFAVAAQPAVVVALVDRIRQLEFGMRTSASSLEEANDRNAAGITRAIADECVVLP